MDSDVPGGHDRFDVAARLTELLFAVGGGGAAFPLTQAANILGTRPGYLRREVASPSTREHIVFDEAADTIRLRASAGMMSGSVSALPDTNRGGTLTDDGEGGRSPLLQPQRYMGRGGGPSGGGGGGGGMRQSGYRSDNWAMGQSTLRRRGAVRKPGQRGGPRGTLERTEAGLLGRVGYICVAEEFDLGQLELRYSSQGYFTKIDLGVLHIRLAEEQWPCQPLKDAPEAAPSTAASAATEANYGATTVPSASAGGGVVSEPTASPTLQHLRRNPFDLFIFEYGAAVWWGSDHRYFKLVENDFLLPDSAIARHMVNRYPTQLVSENYPVWCSYALVRSESLDAGDEFKRGLRFDQFLIPYGRDGDTTLCGISMLCASHALAQSAKIDYLELKVQELTESCSPLPRELREKGRVSITERRLLQLRGEVLSYRLMLKSGSDLLDEPDFFWENAYLKPIFEATKEGFEISARVEALDNKLDATNEILSMLAEEFAQRHGARLEWIVIWLVFVEVIIGVLELLVDIRPWLRWS